MEPAKHSHRVVSEADPVADRRDPQHPPEKPAGKGEYGALWLLAGVCVLIGGTLWMIKDEWVVQPVTEQSRESSVSPVSHEASVGAQPIDVGATLEPGPGDIEQRSRQKAERLIQLQREAERREQERLAAQEKLEAERAAREALERERFEAEERLARERAEREALERERVAAEKRLARERSEREALERKRRVAEQRLARERAARAEIERQARLEKQRLLEQKRAAEQAALDRARAEARVDERASGGEGPDGAPKEAPAQTVETQTPDRAEAPETGQAADGGTFSSNPCDGPAAKFLSTCR